MLSTLKKLPLKKTIPLVYNRHSLFHSTHLNQDRPKDYELKVGYAIATLQEEIPQFFKNGLTDHSIYSSDIVLTDPHYTKLSIHGLTPYLTIARMVRWSTRLYFDQIQLEITTMRVLPHTPDVPPDPTVSFSSVNQTERDLQSQRVVIKNLEVKWKLTSPPSTEVEGVFIYRFDHQGLIREHRIQRIVPAPSRHVLYVHSLGVRLRSLFWEKRPPILNPGL